MPSAVSASFASLRATFIIFVSFNPAHAALQETPGAVLQPAEELALPSDPVPEPLPSVRVTVVGSALSAMTLQRALGPSLQSSYVLHFSSAHRFSARDLFRTQTASPASVHVWVDTSQPGSAQLYFANREGTRYLMRTLELSRPLDEMDREALAQAIEWSLQALLEGSAGLTRSQAEALLSEPSRSPASPPKDPSPPEGDSPEPFRRRTRGFLPEVALLHQWAPHSAELPATQGPALRLGLDHLHLRQQFGFAIGAQSQYPQRHAESGVALELQAMAFRIDARYLNWGLVNGSAIGLRWGLGLDAVFASHEALDWARFEATERRVSGVPLVTGGLVWQLRVAPSVRFEMSVGAEIDLVHIDYEIITNEGTTRLMSRWPARPSVSVGVALF